MPDAAQAAKYLSASLASLARACGPSARFYYSPARGASKGEFIPSNITLANISFKVVPTQTWSPEKEGPTRFTHFEKGETA